MAVCCFFLLAGADRRAARGRAGPPIKPPPPERRVSPAGRGACDRLRGVPRLDRRHRHRPGAVAGLGLHDEGLLQGWHAWSRKGNLLFEIDPRQYKAELDRAEGNVQQIEAHVRRLKKEYDRAKNLLMKGSISQEEYDRYESDFKETEANLEIAKANRDLAALNLEWTEVRAPSAGLLSRRMVDPGNLIKADDTVLTSIVSLDPMYVYFDVHEQDMLKVRRLMREGKIKAKAEKEVPVHDRPVGRGAQFSAHRDRRLHRQPGRRQHRQPAVPGQR